MKLRVFVLKVATIGSFYERNAIIWVIYHMAHCQGPPVQNDGKTFLVFFTYIWQEDVAKISKVPGTPRNVNLNRAKHWLVSVLFYHVSAAIHLHFGCFYATIYFGKKLARGNAH